MAKPVLYSYFRSTSSWRVRLVLTLKGIEYEIKPINLLKGEQSSEEYLNINPVGLLPTLVINGHTLTQSMSIMEYLNELIPNNPLLPEDALQRAKVRQICDIIVSGMQPLQNPSVSARHSPDNANERLEWSKYFNEKGMKVLEQIISKCCGTYCFGDSITLADVCLIPQIYSAKRFNVDLSPYPTIMRINNNLENHPAFLQCHPSAQPDCPEDLK